MLGYYLSIPARGYVDIHEEMYTSRFDEAGLTMAIANVKRTRAEYADEEHYQAALKMFEDALRLLQEERS